MPVLENSIETYLVERVEALGGVAEKVTVLGRRGFFDRLVLLPGGRVIFVECKKPKGARIAMHQRIRAVVYHQLGAEVATVRTREAVDRLLAGQP